MNISNIGTFDNGIVCRTSQANFDICSHGMPCLDVYGAVLLCSTCPYHHWVVLCCSDARSIGDISFHDDHKGSMVSGNLTEISRTARGYEINKSGSDFQTKMKAGRETNVRQGDIRKLWENHDIWTMCLEWSGRLTLAPTTLGPVISRGLFLVNFVHSIYIMLLSEIESWIILNLLNIFSYLP